MRLASLSVATVLAILATPAGAQTAAQRAACEADAKKFCAGTLPGGGRILQCLAKQKDKLTEPCKKVVDSQGR